MRVLLDTNILIHREAAVVVRENIGVLFWWLDRLHHQKCVHPISLDEIERHKDPQVRKSFAAKLAAYQVLKTTAPTNKTVSDLSTQVDATQNDLNDTALLNELFARRVDILISEDRGIARKAERLGIADRLFTIEAFLEKVVAENPDLVGYKVLSVKKELFGNINLADTFFDSFRLDYKGFDDWFNRKSDEVAYICTQDGRTAAFLYLKVEDAREPYTDIVPSFAPKKRLKIGTFKVELNGVKLGERFLKIVFDNAIKARVDEIYVTIFANSLERIRLIQLLEEFGFTKFGEKQTINGTELVYVRDMTPHGNLDAPKTTFPYISRKSRAFLVPIYPQYHTDLLPDSILRTESPLDFSEDAPHRNSIKKVYVSRSVFRSLKRGDTIIFYRTGGKYQSVVTTLGIVEGLYSNIKTEEEFIQKCRKRSVFSDDQLSEQWHYRSSRPFIVGFLYAYSFPKRPNLDDLIQNGVIRDIESAPRGFERITDEQFETILKLTDTDTRVIVD